MSVKYPGREAYAEIDGCRVCYLDEGSGMPILFVHGLGGSIVDWIPTIEYFKQYYRVIAIDLPGFGKSPFVDADYSLDFFAGVIRGLLAKLGVETATLVGNSMGGSITLNLALHHPEIVENIVLVDAAGGFWDPGLLKWGVNRLPAGLIKRIIVLAFMRLLKYPAFYRLNGVCQVNPYTKIQLENAVANAERPDLEDYLEAYIRAARNVLSVRYGERLSDISKPTLIVWGQKDMAISLKEGQHVNRAIKGSFLVAIDRAAHVPQLDQPEVFNSAVRRFLEGSGRGLGAGQDTVEPAGVTRT